MIYVCRCDAELHTYLPRGVGLYYLSVVVQNPRLLRPLDIVLPLLYFRAERWRLSENLKGWLVGA